MAKFLRSILFSSIILLGATAAPSSQSSLAPLSVMEPLGLSAQTPPAPLSVAKPPQSTARTPPAPSPGEFFFGHAERVRSPELDVETNGFASGLDGKQKAGLVLMLLGGSGLLFYGGSMLYQKVRPPSSRRRRFGSLGQPRKLWMV